MRSYPPSGIEFMACAAPLKRQRTQANIPPIPMPLLTFVFLAAEIALLIKLGQFVGGGLLLLEILASAVIGVLLLQSSGRRIFGTRQVLELLTQRPDLRSRNPVLSLVYGALLLLIPGLLTDVGGVVLIVRYLLLGGRPTRSDNGPSDSIDVEFEVQDPPPDDT